MFSAITTRPASRAFLTAALERVGHGDRRDDGILLLGDGGLDQVRMHASASPSALT